MANVNGLAKAGQEKMAQAQGARATFRGVLEKFKGEITAALPMHLKANADRYARQMMSLFSQNPKLQQCQPVTILSALMTATGLGLDLTPQLGQCYIIPYGNEAQFQLGYRGVIALAQRSGELKRIEAKVVHEKDAFDYSFGIGADIKYKPSEEEEPGEIKYIYALAEFRNGGYIFDVWPVKKVIAHAKKFSKNYNSKSSPWQTDFESMAKKTLIMAIWKYLPLSTELMLAGANDGSVKRELGDLQTEKDILMSPSYPVEEPNEDPAPVPEPAGEIVPEMVEPATEPDPKAGLAAEIMKVMGLLDWRSDEAAVFFGKHGGGARLEDMTQEQLYNVLKAARSELARRDAEGR